MRIESDPSISRTKLRITAIILTGLAFAGCSQDQEDFKGGCEKFGVYAQNRWAPLGTAVREAPDVLAPKLDPGFSPNEIIAVKGWVDTDKPAYPTNSPPWNSDVWYRLANHKGWVSFAGVRAVPTTPDPTGFEDGGQPAPTSDECKGTYEP